MTDPYALLGVERTATPEQIRQAFKRAAMRAHPDRGGTVEAFQALKAAFELLSDPIRRAAHDDPSTNTGGSAVMTPEYAARRAAREDVNGVCSLCGGEGVIRVAGSIFWTKNPCPKCKGNGGPRKTWNP